MTTSTPTPTPKPCLHDIVERETAVTADGMCPLCLAAQLAEARKTALEEAAVTVETHPGHLEQIDDEIGVHVEARPQELAAAIRSLKSTPPTPVTPSTGGDT